MVHINDCVIFAPCLTIKQNRMINKKFEILLLNNLKTALNYTVDNLLSLETLRVRNICILLKSEIEKTINDLRENENGKTK